MYFPRLRGSNYYCTAPIGAVASPTVGEHYSIRHPCGMDQRGEGAMKRAIVLTLKIIGYIVLAILVGYVVFTAKGVG